MFQWEQSRWFNKRAFEQAHAFYEKYGGITIVLARFMPFLRTFAPFVAGVAQMTRRKFTFYDVTGGALWVGSLTLAGYLFGNVPLVKDNLDKIIWAMILIPGLIVSPAHGRRAGARAAPERPGNVSGSCGVGCDSARRSSAAHSATAVFASSSTLPIRMKPWICRSKQTYAARLPAAVSASAYCAPSSRSGS